MSVSNRKLDIYNYHQVEAREIKEGQVGFTCVALAVGLFFTAVAFVAVKYDVLSFGMKMAGNSVTVLVGGGWLSVFSATVVWHRFNTKIAKHTAAITDDTLFRALIEQALDPKKDVGERFALMLHADISEENYLKVLKAINKQEHQEEKKLAYETLFKAHPIRFINNYNILKAKNALCEETCKTLEAYLPQALSEKIAELDAEQLRIILDDRVSFKNIFQTLNSDNRKTFNRLLKSHFLGFLTNYCELKAQNLLTSEKCQAIENLLEDKLKYATLQYDLLLEISDTYFDEKPKKGPAKYMILKLLAKYAPQYYMQSYLANFYRVSEAFRLKALHVLKDTPAIIPLLKKMNCRQWHHLLTVIDKIHGSKVHEATLLERMYETDKTKMVQAYLQKPSEFSEDFHAWFADCENAILYNLPITLPLIKMYFRTQSELKPNIKEILEPKILEALYTFPNWGEIILHADYTKITEKELWTPKSLLKAMCDQDREKFTENYGYFEEMPNNKKVKLRMSTEAQNRIEKIIQKQIEKEIRESIITI